MRDWSSRRLPPRLSARFTCLATSETLIAADLTPPRRTRPREGPILAHTRGCADAARSGRSTLDAGSAHRIHAAAAGRASAVRKTGLARQLLFDDNPWMRS